jgi:hypothetical protein
VTKAGCARNRDGFGQGYQHIDSFVSIYYMNGERLEFSNTLSSYTEGSVIELGPAAQIITGYSLLKHSTLVGKTNLFDRKKYTFENIPSFKFFI